MRQLTQAGVSLIEVLITVAISAVLAVAAAPSMADYYQNSKLRDSANIVSSVLQLARAEALRQNLTTSVDISGGTVRLFYSATAEGLPSKSFPLPSGVSSGNSRAVFASNGLLVPFGAPVSFSLAPSGQACSNTGIRCPRVMVEAGGASRVCSAESEVC